MCHIKKKNGNEAEHRGPLSSDYLHKDEVLHVEFVCLRTLKLTLGYVSLVTTGGLSVLEKPSNVLNYAA